MSIKAMLKKNKLVRKIYYTLKPDLRFNDKYTCINRSKGSNKLCYILAGYKSFAWDIIFDRIHKFVPNDIDVCIISGGLYNEKLNTIAENYKWSYLYSKTNNISLIQNITIKEFKNAEYIYKLDEDIFVTENYFENLFECLLKTQDDGYYDAGFVAPLITINGFSHVEVLKRFDLVKEYENRFEKIKYMASSTRMIESNPETAKFMWGENNIVPHIDDMNRMVNNDEKRYVACPIRFSIGAILFTRKTWEAIGGFRVTSKKVIDLGIDETQICEYCISLSHPIIVCKNSIVGHLSFGKQNKAMAEYYLNKPDHFAIKGQ